MSLTSYMIAIEKDSFSIEMINFHQHYPSEFSYMCPCTDGFKVDPIARVL